MALANELFDAAELTGIARAELENLEEQSRSASLARWLPNEYVASHTAEYHVADFSKNDTARYRAFDAEPERGREHAGVEKSVKLPAISQTQAISESTKINLRSLGDEALRQHIIRTLRQTVISVYNRVNLQRATVLTTGRATVNQKNYKLDDDFGRDPSLTTTATNLWTDTSVSRLDYLLTLSELYTEVSGEEPGAIVAPKQVVSSLVRGDEFAIEMASGATRRGNRDEVFSFIEASGLPPIYQLDARVNGQSLLPTNGLLMLPAPVDPNTPEATELGSTVWGLTATALAEGFNIEEADLPGIVAGVDAPNRVPYVHEVFADSVTLPVLKQANLSLFAEVL